jgi:hypothetical protein
MVSQKNGVDGGLRPEGSSISRDFEAGKSLQIEQVFFPAEMRRIHRESPKSAWLIRRYAVASVDFGGEKAIRVFAHRFAA